MTGTEALLSAILGAFCGACVGGAIGVYLVLIFKR
jgi:hypothetical protein